MQNNKKIGVKDIVFMGVFSAILFVLSMVFMTIMGVTAPLYVFYPAVFALAASPVYMLVVAKVAKPGAFLIPALIMGILLLFMGAQTILVAMVLFGLLAELVMRGHYESFVRTRIAYVILMAGFFIGDIGPIYIFTGWYIHQATGGVAGADMTYLNALIDSARSWLGLASILLTIAAAWIGCGLSRSLMRRHFERAGII